jgi:hypothetical protein
LPLYLSLVFFPILKSKIFPFNKEVFLFCLAYGFLWQLFSNIPITNESYDDIGRYYSQMFYIFKNNNYKIHLDDALPFYGLFSLTAPSIFRMGIVYGFGNEVLLFFIVLIASFVYFELREKLKTRLSSVLFFFLLVCLGPLSQFNHIYAFRTYEFQSLMLAGLLLALNSTSCIIILIFLLAISFNYSSILILIAAGPYIFKIKPDFTGLKVFSFSVIALALSAFYIRSWCITGSPFSFTIFAPDLISPFFAEPLTSLIRVWQSKSDYSKPITFQGFILSLFTFFMIFPIFTTLFNPKGTKSLTHILIVFIFFTLCIFLLVKGADVNEYKRYFFPVFSLCLPFLVIKCDEAYALLARKKGKAFGVIFIVVLTVLQFKSIGFDKKKLQYFFTTNEEYFKYRKKSHVTDLAKFFRDIPSGEGVLTNFSDFSPHISQNTFQISTSRLNDYVLRSDLETFMTRYNIKWLVFNEQYLFDIGRSIGSEGIGQFLYPFYNSEVLKTWTYHREFKNDRGRIKIFVRNSTDSDDLIFISEIQKRLKVNIYEFIEKTSCKIYTHHQGESFSLSAFDCPDNGREFEISFAGENITKDLSSEKCQKHSSYNLYCSSF